MPNRSNTAAWTAEQLDQVEAAVELELASYRPDGTLRSYVTMWVVRHADDLYVRSAGGPDRPWYRQAVSAGAGRVRAGGVEADVTFARAADSEQLAIDSAYHAKYDDYGATVVGHVVGDEAYPVTVRLVADPARR